jgi:hypothetical protein
MGAALINTIATSATATFIVTHGHSPAELQAGAIHGYTTAFTFSGIVLAVAAVTTFGLIRRAKAQEQTVGELDKEVFVEETEAVALAGAGAGV